MRTSLAGVQGGIAETEAELSHALVVRDILIARINALSDQLEQVYQSNAARVLDAKTLDAIQAQYNSLRQSLLTRAQAVARLAENAFNFERDADTHLIKDAYYDTSLEGYTAAETLLHDLGGFDHIDLIGRTRKAMQLSHMISLRKHNPLSFLALAATGNGRFTTTLRGFRPLVPRHLPAADQGGPGRGPGRRRGGASARLPLERRGLARPLRRLGEQAAGRQHPRLR